MVLSLNPAGYYVLNNSTLISQQSFFGQLWKEYGLSDSRYLSQDPFVLCIESVTVVGRLKFSVETWFLHH